MKLLSFSDLTVETDLGTVVGFADPYPLSDQSIAIKPPSTAQPLRLPVVKWLGLPFATAGRWERPQPVKKWEGEKQCWEYGPSPLQADKVDGWAIRVGFHERKHIGMSEDCLSLNIFLAQTSFVKRDNIKIPVMVYIHGGGFQSGKSHTVKTDPTEFIRLAENEGSPLLVITGNYRVNMFGFLAHSDLSTSDPDGLAGNYGLHDQLALLRWVKANIILFGGDPDNITVYGESAGGTAIGALLTRRRHNDREEKLFKRACLMSGFPGTMSFRSLDKSYPLYPDLLSHFNIPSHLPSAEKVSALRSIPTCDFQSYAIEAQPNGFWSITEEVGAKATFVESPLKCLNKGIWDPYVEEVVLGCNEDEGTFFGSAIRATTLQGHEKYLSALSPHQRVLFDSLYPPPAADNPPTLASSSGAQIRKDSLYNGAMMYMANALTSSPAPLKTYIYALRALLPNLAAQEQFGCHHALDIPLVFRTKMTAAWTEDSEEEMVSTNICRRWISIAHGRLNSDPRWVLYNSNDPKRTLFANGGKVVIESMVGWKEKEMELWMKALDARDQSHPLHQEMKSLNDLSEKLSPKAYSA